MSKKTAEERAEGVIDQHIMAFRRKYGANPYQTIQIWEEFNRGEAKRKKREEIKTKYAKLNKDAGPLGWIIIILAIAIPIIIAYLITEAGAK